MRQFNSPRATRSTAPASAPASALGLALATTLALGLAATPAALADSTIQRTMKVERGGLVDVDVEVGSVEVIGSSRKDVKLEISSRGDDLEDQFDVAIDTADGNLRIKIDRKGKSFSWMRWDGRNNLRITVEVPSKVDVRVDTSGSRIQVENIDGDVNLDTSGGRIEATNIRGDVLADTSGSDIVIDDVDGDVVADTSGGNITASKISGDVRADTSGGRIDVSDVGGSVEADTSGGSIRIDGVGGRVSGDTSGGSITVSFKKGAPFEGGALSTSGGTIKVYLQPGVNLDLDAAASGGSVVSDIPIRVQGKVSSSRLVGSLGKGGPSLKLRTSGGTIRISEQ